MEFSPEEEFALQLQADGIYFEREYYAIKNRKFRWDFFIANRLLVEIQGGIWVPHSGHNTGRAITRDCNKLNLATLAGYDVMSFTTDMVRDGTAIELVKQYLNT